MKVLLVNGSGHAKGCTYTALEEVAGALEKNGIETEIIQVGTQPIAGCIGCNACLKNGKCFREDGVNEFVEKAKTADGFVFGSPVHYASACAGVSGPVVLRGRQRAAVQARRGGRLGPARRHNRRAGRAEQIFYHQLYAGGIQPVLESGTRQYSRRGKTGSGRHADHAYPG